MSNTFSHGAEWFSSLYTSIWNICVVSHQISWNERWRCPFLCLNRLHLQLLGIRQNSANIDSWFLRMYSNQMNIMGLSLACKSSLDKNIVNVFWHLFRLIQLPIFYLKLDTDGEGWPLIMWTLDTDTNICWLPNLYLDVCSESLDT